jgi:hypothetical protein
MVDISDLLNIKKYLNNSFFAPLPLFAYLFYTYPNDMLLLISLIISVVFSILFIISSAIVKMRYSPEKATWPIKAKPTLFKDAVSNSRILLYLNGSFLLFYNFYLGYSTYAGILYLKQELQLIPFILTILCGFATLYYAILGIISVVSNKEELVKIAKISQSVKKR